PIAIIWGASNPVRRRVAPSADRRRSLPNEDEWDLHCLYFSWSREGPALQLRLDTLPDRWIVACSLHVLNGSVRSDRDRRGDLRARGGDVAAIEARSLHAGLARVDDVFDRPLIEDACTR